MSTGIKVPNGKGTAHGAPGIDFAYRSLVSSHQQKLFEKVLNEVRPSGVDSSKEEINSLQSEINGLQAANTNSQKIDQMRLAASQPQTTSDASPRQRGTFNDLTTSAILRLAALNPQRAANLSGYYREALGTMSPSSRAASVDLDIESDRAQTQAPRETAASPKDPHGPGSLSARFESGENGAGTIGYDDGGGTSYGIYQIASRTGTMEQFLDYLEEKAPELAGSLRSASRANTGSTGGAMPREWKKIAVESPERFAQLQHDFIEKSHYLPALDEIYRRTGLDIEKQSRALQEVLWSTAVQHGPKGAVSIFTKAIEQGQSNGQKINDDRLIASVYSSRAGYLGGLSRDVREAVSRRFQEEKSMALAMLAGEGTSSHPRA